ncbi:MAG: hypothetical protein GX079_07890 [Tissierellia bacterium]|nr:hypothetical protein [Tissierellia bacterium]
MRISTGTTRVLAWIIFIFTWTIIALLVNNGLYLPSPWETLLALKGILVQKQTYLILGLSTLRVTLGLVLALTIGSFLGLLGGFNRTVSILLTPLESLLKSVPVVSFIMLALLWIGSRGVPIFISFLMTMPIFWSAVEASVKQADPKLLEMMDVFSLGFYKKLKYFYLPWAAGYLKLAIRQAVGLAWKAAVAAEVLSNTPLSLGRKIQESKVYLETADLFAWTLLLLLFSFLMERLVRHEA